MAFHTTRWSLIARAHGDDAVAKKALDDLCCIYWPPVYAMYRGEGMPSEQARDLTQGLFASLLERHDFELADPQKGRFRAFLRTCARNWLANERDRERALKRGGAAKTFSLDAGDEEQRYLAEPHDQLDAAALFERRWAQAVIEQALSQLEQAEKEAGRGHVFASLRPVLEGDAPAGSWAELAAELATTEGALRVAAHRLRQRFRERLEAEVRDTLSDEQGPDAELAELLAALGS